MTAVPISPLLDADTFLDSRQQAVVRRVHDAEQAKAATLPTDDELDSKRRRRVELTREEMWAQPQAIAETLGREADDIKAVAKQIATRDLDRAVLVGCGDSLAVMVGMRLFLESVVGVPCEPAQALDFAYYGDAHVDERTLVVALSSSGETTRTVEAALVAQHRGAMTLALSNSPGSTLVEESDLSLRIHATRRGWPTQASTAAMALLFGLGLEIAACGRTRLSSPVLDTYERTLQDLPQQIATTLEACDGPVRQAAAAAADRQLYLFAGGGPAYASSMFGAAKIKECSPNHAIAIPLEEYHHYNSQKAGDPLWLTVPAGRTRSRALDTAREARRVGGRLYIVDSGDDEAFTALADGRFPLPPTPEAVAAILYTAPAQLFAYHVATEKFVAADRRSA